MTTTVLKNELLTLFQSQRLPYAEVFIYDAQDIIETTTLSNAPSQLVAIRSVTDLANLNSLMREALPLRHFRRRLNECIENASAESWLAPSTVYESINTWRDDLPAGEFLYSEGTTMLWIAKDNSHLDDLEHTIIETPMGADTDWLAFRSGTGGFALSTPTHPNVPARMIITQSFAPMIESIAIELAEKIESP